MAAKDITATPGMSRQFLHLIPHAKAIGMEVVEVEPGIALIRLPYDPKLIGNPETGVVHGGVITTLIDNTCGLAVFSARGKALPLGTLDIRIDYLKPATPGEEIFARAECYKMTRQIAFVRATAFHGDPSDPIATCAATFMLDSGPEPEPGKTP